VGVPGDLANERGRFRLPGVGEAHFDRAEGVALHAHRVDDVLRRVGVVGVPFAVLRGLFVPAREAVMEHHTERAGARDSTSHTDDGAALGAARLVGLRGRGVLLSHQSFPSGAAVASAAFSSSRSAGSGSWIGRNSAISEYASTPAAMKHTLTAISFRVGK